MDQTEHPDIALAKKHRERRDRISAARETESEPDLRQAVRELADIVSTLCANLDVLHPIDKPAMVRLWERAQELKEQLS